MNELSLWCLYFEMSRCSNLNTLKYSGTLFILLSMIEFYNSFVNLIFSSNQYGNLTMFYVSKYFLFVNIHLILFVESIVAQYIY